MSCQQLLVPVESHHGLMPKYIVYSPSVGQRARGLLGSPSSCNKIACAKISTVEVSYFQLCFLSL